MSNLEVSSLQSDEEIEEEFTDPDPDQVFEDYTPRAVEAHREFICPVCGAAFTTDDQLITHNFVKHAK